MVKENMKNMRYDDRELLLIDSCGRLPYGICANLKNHYSVSHIYYINAIDSKYGWTTGILNCAGRNQIYSAKIEDVIPYLRPISSMTEEEFVYFMDIRGKNLRSDEIQKIMSETFNNPNKMSILNTLSGYSHNIDWLNRNMFDYRGLIEKGLAIKVTAENNPYKLI